MFLLSLHKRAIDKMEKDADKNGDGEIDFDEFMEMMRGTCNDTGPKRS